MQTPNIWATGEQNADGAEWMCRSSFLASARFSAQTRAQQNVMPELDKKSLTEQDIRTKFITPALTVGNKWDVMNQIREEVYFTKGRVIVRGQSSTRGEPKKADYVLSYKPGIRLAVLEAKDNNHPVGGGMQQ